MDHIVTWGGLAFQVPEHGIWGPDPCTLGTARLAAEVVDDGEIVIDLGVGSGCQGIYVARQRHGVHVMGTDRMTEAILIARRNAMLNRVWAAYFHADLFGPIAKGKVIINTLPYEPPEYYQDTPSDGLSEQTYIGDGSFGRALYYGLAKAEYMAVYGQPGFEEAFGIAGWKVAKYVDEPDDVRHYLLEHA